MTEEERRGRGGSSSSRMAWIARLPLQHVAVFFASTGTFAVGVILGWNSFGGWMYRSKVSWEMTKEDPDPDVLVATVSMGGCFGALILLLFKSFYQRRDSDLVWIYLVFLVLGWFDVNKAGKWNLLSGRFLNGLSVGIFSTLLPIFIGEVASPVARDRLLYFAHATMSCGYAVSYGFVDTEAEDLSSYNLYCALACLPAILCCLSMCFNPVKSMVYGEEDAARKASLFYNSNMNAAQLDRRMQELREMVRTEKTLKPRSIRQFLTVLALTICHHLSGASTILFNVLTIVDFSGPNDLLTGSQLCFVCAICQVISTLLGLLLVNRLGRRILLSFSATLMAVALGLLGWIVNAVMNGEEIFQLLSPIFIVVYYSAYGLGFGPVIWAMLSDSFTTRSSFFSAPIVASGWAVSVILNLYLGNLLDNLGVDKLLWSFVGFSLLSALLGCCLVQETRGKSLLDLQRQYLNG